MKTNGRVLKNVFITSLRGCPQAESLSTTRKRESEDPPTWKTVLEKCMDLKVSLVNMDLAIAKFKGEGEIEIVEAPTILGDPGFFEEPEGDPSGE